MSTASLFQLFLQAVKSRDRGRRCPGQLYFVYCFPDTAVYKSFLHQSDVLFHYTLARLTVGMADDDLLKWLQLVSITQCMSDYQMSMVFKQHIVNYISIFFAN